MIKVEKDLTAIPESLIPAFSDLFPPLGKMPLHTKRTHKKRMIVIDGEAYIDKDGFNDRYKWEDIKIALNNIYHCKCAYCENKIEQYHVEHYRPKKTYYWLAFSWDNLLVACATCNIEKGQKFDLDGPQETFTNIEANIRNINTSSAGYNRNEQPRMVNPEVINPAGHIRFQRNGIIESDHPRFIYTIRECAIDRDSLNDLRRHLLEVFERDIRSALIDNQATEDQEAEIRTIVRKFIRDSNDIELPFLGFRRYSISVGWLNTITKEQKDAA